MQKTTVHHHSYLALVFAAFMAKLHAIMDSVAPIGYQDETGFHRGVQRADKH